MICEIINIVHSRGMFFLCLNLYIVYITCLRSMELNKKLLKNKKESVLVYVLVATFACIWVCANTHLLNENLSTHNDPLQAPERSP